jgi:hypothetical protein
MKLRSIKLRGKGKGLTLNVAKVEQTHIMDNFGNLLPKSTELFGKDPRGNWHFSDTGNGYCEYVLKETEDWDNKTPLTAPDSVLQMNPNIIRKYGPQVPYVSLEEALMALLKQMKPYIRLKEIQIVCDKDNKEVVRFLAERGWPKQSIVNYDLAYTETVAEKNQSETPSSTLIQEEFEEEEVEEQLSAITPPVPVVRHEPVVFDTDQIKKLAQEVTTPIKKAGRPRKQQVEVTVK